MLRSLVGGYNLSYYPDLTLLSNSLNVLSPDSRRWSFDERPNGYARVERVGVVVLKGNSEAMRGGNAIRAVIRATGLNQEGRIPGLSQPSQDSKRH